MFCDEHGTADYCGECVYGPEIETLQQQLAASQSEARELRAELARVRELVSGMREYADSCGHPSEVSKRNAVEYWLAQLEDALSQAAEREGLPLMARREWMRLPQRTEAERVIDRKPVVFEDRQCCPDGGRCHHECHDECWRTHHAAPLSSSGLNEDWTAKAEQPPEHESLPLMARRPRHKDDDLGELYENGKRLCTISGEPPLREPMPGFVLYRIADTDEHGLKVIPREPGMPEWARYRWPTYGGFAYSVVFAPWMRLSSEVARIEDYRESGQEGKK